MRVITVETFGRVANGTSEHGFVYEGDAWLFRFTIQSEAHFFSAELPGLVERLGIDVRQIYRLALYGWPGVGLCDVRVYVSFEAPPDENAVNSLQLAVPASEPSDYAGGCHPF